MPRHPRYWTDLDSDECRLPEGFTRVGYDADEGRYDFLDQDGQTWRSEPGNKYGTLAPVWPEPPVTIPRHPPYSREAVEDPPPRAFMSTFNTFPEVLLGSYQVHPLGEAAGGRMPADPIIGVEDSPPRAFMSTFNTFPEVLLLGSYQVHPLGEVAGGRMPADPIIGGSGRPASAATLGTRLEVLRPDQITSAPAPRRSQTMDIPPLRRSSTTAASFIRSQRKHLSKSLDNPKESPHPTHHRRSASLPVIVRRAATTFAAYVTGRVKSGNEPADGDPPTTARK